jgi:hypothetical protein
MQGSALRNLRMFRELCGPQCLPNVVLATTFWENVAEQDGVKREKELRDNDEFWGRMVKKGSQIVRLKQKQASGVNVLLKIAANSKITLCSQEELVEKNKSMREMVAAMAAAIAVAEEHDKLRQMEDMFLGLRLEAEERAEEEFRQEQIRHEEMLTRERLRLEQEEVDRCLAEEMKRAEEEEFFFWNYWHEQQKIDSERERLEQLEQESARVARELQEEEDRQQRELELLRSQQERWRTDHTGV